ncbi:MAG: MBL fold metallo-hydrolase [Phycisphaerales bacterium]
MKPLQRSSPISIVLFFLLTTAVVAQDVSVRRVTDRVITLSMSNLGMHTNITVIESQKGLVVIETEITPFIMSKIKEAAEKYLGRNDWTYVINTHNHLHHAGGNALFENVRIIGHKNMRMDWLENRLSTEKGRRKYCDNVGTRQGISNLSRLLKQTSLTPSRKREIQRRINFIREVEKEIMSGFEVRNPDISFNDRFTLDLGDVHLQLLYWGDAINHSSIFVHVVEDNMLIGMGMGGKWLPNFYGKVSLNSIRHGISVLKELCDEDLQIDIMIGVHSPDLIRTKQRFRRELSYLQDMLDGLIQARQEGLSLEQVKDRFAFNKRYTQFRRDFTLPQDINKKHQDNIEKIWKLLDREESLDSSHQ